jgi:hypothetical protein
MVFLFDSLCAIILFASAILSWWMAADTAPEARINLRFAAFVLTMLSAARLVPAAALELDLALLAPSLAAAAVALALCAPRRCTVWFSSLALIAAMASGFMAALAAMPALALGYQVGAALVILAWSFSRLSDVPRAAFSAALASLALLLGAMTVMDGALSAAMLLFAVFLLLATRASQHAVADIRHPGNWRVSSERI